MKIKLIGSIVVLGSLMIFNGCGGGGNDNPPTTPPAPDSSINPVNHDADFYIQMGSDRLADNDYRSAKTIFCEALNKYPNEPRAAFGCALTTYIFLAESDPIKAIWQGAGEKPVGMKDQIFNDNGFFDILMTEYYTPRAHSYNPWDSAFGIETGKVDRCDFDLPIVRIVCTSYETMVLKHLVYVSVKNKFSLSDLQEQLKAYADSLEKVHDLLSIAKNSGTFDFTIPADFFHTKGDVKILPADIYAFDLGVQSERFLIYLANKYNVAYDLSKWNLSEYEMNTGEMVKALNGEYGLLFPSLKPGVTNIQDLRPLFDDMISDAKAAVIELRKAGGTELFAKIVDGHKLKFEKTETLLNELESSLDNDVMTKLSIFDGARTVKVNLFRFFSSPPDAKKLPVDTPDPIDYFEVCGPFTYYSCSLEYYTEQPAIDGGLSPEDAAAACAGKSSYIDNNVQYLDKQCYLDEYISPYTCTCQINSCNKKPVTYQRCEDNFSFVESFFKKLFEGILEFSL